MIQQESHGFVQDVSGVLRGGGNTPEAYCITFTQGGRARKKLAGGHSATFSIKQVHGTYVAEGKYNRMYWVRNVVNIEMKV
jgi:hypothetical protein